MPKRISKEESLSMFWLKFKKANDIHCDVNLDMAEMLNKYFCQLGLIDFIDRQAFINKYYPILKDQYKHINNRQATELILIMREHLN